MEPSPVVLGLTICEKAIVEEGTKNITLVSTFARMNAEAFPSRQKFAVHASLTEGAGAATIELVITNLQDAEEIYSIRGTLSFPDPLAEVRALFRVNNCEFPEAGAYQITLYADGEPLARRVLHIVERQG